MKLVERHIIRRNHKLYKECDNICFLAKNVYNSALYSIRQHYFNENEYLSFVDNYHQLKYTDDYTNLPTKVSKQILKLVDKNFKSFFSLIKKKNYNKKINIPNYKEKDGRSIAIYPNDAIYKKTYDKEKKIHLSKTNIKISTNVDYNSIKQVRVIPKGNHIIIEVIYEKKEKESKKNNNRYCSIDLGVNNLMTVGSNYLKPIIINGKPIKSINQYYNKKKSEIQSELEVKNKKKWSNKLSRLTLKRENKINDYLHKSSRYIMNHLVSNNINTLVVGYNKEWKQDINIGSKNNQNFVGIPFYKLINMLEYKCKLLGINFIQHEESYTSKCSFLDDEDVRKHDKYLGRRIKRGLFKSSKGKIINADLNGALNILKKVVSNAFQKVNEIVGLAVNPIKFSI